jgi:hypothetical protein
MLIDRFIEFYILTLHVLLEISPDILDRGTAPLPSWRSFDIPERDDIDMFLHFFCHSLHLERASPPVATLRVRDDLAFRPNHNPRGYAAVLPTCLCQSDFSSF